MWEPLQKLIDIVLHWNVFVNLVKAAILAAEESNASGEEKRNAVITAVIQAMKTSFGLDLTGLTKAIEQLVNLLVAVFNALGVFQHSSTDTTTDNSGSADKSTTPEIKQ